MKQSLPLINITLIAGIFLLLYSYGVRIQKIENIKQQVEKIDSNVYLNRDYYDFLNQQLVQYNNYNKKHFNIAKSNIIKNKKAIKDKISNDTLLQYFNKQLIILHTNIAEQNELIHFLEIEIDKLNGYQIK